jgi:hypothetical protein
MGVALFPGENEMEQLACIMEVLGLPPQSLMNQNPTRQKLFFDSAGLPRIVANSKGRKRRPGTRSLAGVVRCQDSVFLDFVARCLEWVCFFSFFWFISLKMNFLIFGNYCVVIRIRN